MVFYADLCLVGGFQLGSSLLPDIAKLAADHWNFVGWDDFMPNE